MRFELTAEQQAAKDRARAFATERVASRAGEIDRSASVPPDLAHEAGSLVSSGADDLSVVLTVEELASASGSVAVAAATQAQPPGAPIGLSGLRGGTALANTPRSQLILAAVALGLGKAALEIALAELRQAAAVRGSAAEKPHWIVADAATELEAARMLAYKAAVTRDERESETANALARLMAAGAARHAVEAALRVAGAAGYQEGAVLERLLRDVQAASLILGTEEQQRSTAAEGLFPA